MALPPLNALTVFEAVGRRGNMTLAAEELAVTPGAASRQIKRLEAALGVELFSRKTRQLTLTDLGKTYWSSVHRLLGELEKESEAIKAAHGQRVLRVKCSRMVLRNWLLPLFPDFLRANPDVHVRFIVGRPGETVDEEADCYVHIGENQRLEFGADRLFALTLTPVCTPAYLRGRPPLAAIDDLRHHTLLVSSSQPHHWPRWLGAHENLLDQASTLQFDGDGLAFQGAEEGIGIAFARAELIGPDLQSGRLVAPFQNLRHVQDNCHFIYPIKDHPVGFRRFRQWLRREARRHIEALGIEDAATGHDRT